MRLDELSTRTDPTRRRPPRCRSGLGSNTTALGAALALLVACTSTPERESSDSNASAGSVSARESGETMPPAAGDESGMPPVDGDMRAEIEAANRALEDRFRAGDLLGVADMYADDGLLLGPNGYRVEGREAIDAYWSRTTDPVIWTLDIDEIGGGEGLAYQTGTSTLVALREGEAMTSIVDFMLLWQQQEDGTWRILVDSYWNPDE